MARGSRACGLPGDAWIGAGWGGLACGGADGTQGGIHAAALNSRAGVGSNRTRAAGEARLERVGERETLKIRPDRGRINAG